MLWLEATSRLKYLLLYACACTNVVGTSLVYTKTKNYNINCYIHCNITWIPEINFEIQKNSYHMYFVLLFQ